MPVNGTGTVAGGAHSSSSVESKEPIAIVGIGCRYPGASNVEELWENLLAGKDSIGPYPSGRFPGVDRAYESSQKKPGRLFTDAGGFLSNVDGFDSQFFEISPRESIYVDPQHRLLLEVAWEALEDAGQVRSTYEGSNAGVFVGLWTSEYETRLYESGNEADFYSITGCARASASGRVSFTFGLEGPSVTVDTACSSSLVAVHLACKSLWVGESEMALAGGANLILGPEISELFTKASMLSPDGRCKFGDASANGFVRSEGAGIVVLKRLSRARADGDRVYAVIRGGATNNDGRSSGLLVTPSRPGQRQMLLSAWKAAGIDPAMLRYIEAHGTGTGVGDPVEIGAIADALTAAGVKDSCALGSIKTNFGHTEAASGIAGLIKTALVLQHRMIPPSLHCKTPNPKIKWDRAPIQVATEAIDLQDEPGRLLAGVSSFGITGTNAHIVLEEVEQQVAARPDVGCPLVLPISARSPEALHELLCAYLKDVRVQAQKWPIHDLCYTASVRRNHHEFRTAIVCADLAELEERLAAAADDEACDGVVSGRSSSARRRVVFVAPGQGSQWLGMARELYDKEPVFHQAFEECARAILAETGWSLTDRLLGEQAEQYLSEIDVIQPALFTMSVALAAVWKAWGVEPDAVVGHSMGEVAAAHLAGVLSLPDAAAVICRRSRLMKTLRSSGGMATVDLPLKQTEELLEGISSLSVAASNGPRTTVISGDLKALEALLNELKAKEIYCRQVKVDVASHSSQVDPILEQLRQTLSEIRPQPSRIPMVSTVTGNFAFREGETGTLMDADYWVRNLRQCVLLAPVVKRFCETGHDVFIELSPHPILLPSIESAAREVSPQVLAVASLRREKPARATILSGLAGMYTEGYTAEWERFYPEGGLCVRLPQYPFQREHCWPEPGTTKRSDILDTMGNPLLGRQFTSSRQPQTILWESEISLAAIPYLTDHRVLRSAVFPASAYVEMALSGVRALFPAQSFEVRNAAFLNAAYLPEEGNRIFQLAISPEGAEAFSFEIRSRAEEGDASWTLHTTGQIHRGKEEDGEKPRQVSIPELQVVYEEVCEGKDHYGRLAKSGLHYGPAFQVVEKAWVGNLEALCQLRGDADEQSRYLIHPAILDASFQTMALVFPTGDGFHPEDTYLPVSIEGIRIHQPIPAGGQLFAHTFLVSSSPERGSFRVNVGLLDAEGSVLAEVVEMEMKRVAHQDAGDAIPSLYTFRWIPEPGVQKKDAVPDFSGQRWLLFVDKAGVAETLKDLLAPAKGRFAMVRPGSQFARISEIEFEIRPDSSSDHDLLLAEMSRSMGAPTAIVHLWTLDGAQASDDYDADGLIRSQQTGSQHVPLVVQAVNRANWRQSPRLWIVTGGSMAIDGENDLPRIEHAPLWGIGRTVAREHPELQGTLVDLSAAPNATESLALARRILQNGREDRIALRGENSYVARLGAHVEAEPASRALAEGEAYRFEIDNAGVLDNLRLRAFAPRLPGPGEVAIEVVASGLNFIDVAKAIGIYPGLDPDEPLRFGMESAGRVIAVGEGVDRWRAGDEVLAVTPSIRNGLLASHAVLPAELIFRKPTNLNFEQAATSPITFLTAYYALIELAGMREGDWVLIHAAAGGVGLAAIEIAKSVGAKIIATVGSKEKENYVRSLGVQHVFDSRSLDFSAGVMEVTQQRGVDIVLNSLSGEFIRRGLDVLAPYGRFVELGKRDVYDDLQLGLKVFRRNLSFHVVDLAAALEERRSYVVDLLKSVMTRIEKREWQPLPVTVHSAGEPSGAFRFMAQARHIGKIAVSMRRDVQVLPAVDTPLFRADATYLITGGLGGIALKVAQWMAETGAGHLALLSRRTVNEEAAEAIRRIESAGARVQVLQADITRQGELDRALSAIRQSGHPLKGIMHTAAVVDNALIRELTPETFRPVMAPKIEGTWRLHQTTLEEKLDFFVLFSSISAIHPQPGVGNYAAANAFLDTFAHYRRAHGLPATSINWGAWHEIGILAPQSPVLANTPAISRSIEDYVLQGLGKLSVEQGIRALEAAMRSESIHVVGVPFDWKTLTESYGLEQAPPLFAEFTSRIAEGSTAQSKRSEILELLNGAESAERRNEITEDYLQETLSLVLKLAKRKIDRERPMGTMGLDSLMGLEFVRRLSQALEIAVPATVVFNYPTIRVLAPHLIGRSPLRVIEDARREETNVVSSNSTFAPLSIELSEEDALEALISDKGGRA
jgi:acyl transferase domain-containing protein